MTTTNLPVDWAPPTALVDRIRIAAGLPATVCRLCASALIRTEIPFGTCGQCGDRAIHPAVSI